MTRRPTHRALTLSLAVVWLVSALTTHADTLSGRVVDISDGDTFTLQSDHEVITVRLAEIDAPEGDQPYGVQSRQTLAGLVANREVQVVVQAIDRYGRAVGRVYVDSADVCREMVRRGAAWAYRRYLHDRRLLDDEQLARRESAGLWADSASAVAPWEWRSRAQGEHCDIKGNISGRGERIYHVPGQRYYAVTQINTAKGERWFCNEAEAHEAGWRRARQ